MSDEFVTRTEFESLARKVEKLETMLEDSEKILGAIDKKVDVIVERISSSSEKEELKLKPINLRIDKNEERLKKLEEAQTWLWRTTGATIIGLAIKYWMG